jgi:hypothetical protein
MPKKDSTRPALSVLPIRHSIVAFGFQRSVRKALRPAYGLKFAVLLLSIMIPSNWNVTEASEHRVPTRIITDGSLQAISGNGRYVFDRPHSSSSSFGVRRHDLETGETLIFEFLSFSPVAVDHSGSLILYKPEQGAGHLYVYDVATGTSEVVTVTMDGSVPVIQTTPSMTTDGRFVVFSSRSSAFVEGDTNDKWDVFIYDRDAGTTELVSVGLGGAPADADSNGDADRRLGVSDDGRFVIFESNATNLTADETTTSHTFLRDRWAGVTRRLSQTNTGEEVEATTGPVMSAINREGTYALFVMGWSSLTNITSRCCSTIVVVDLASGLRFQALFGLDGAPPNGHLNFFPLHYQTPLFAREGRFIVFTSSADNLVVGDASAHHTSLFALDRTAGTTTLLSVNDQGVQLRTDFRFDVSADGRVVVFEGRSLEQIVPDPLAGIYLLDRGDVYGPDVFGILSPTTAPLGDTFVLSAYADDSGDRGNNVVVSGDYRMDDGPWWPMEADDGAFDSPTEQMVAVVSTDLLGPGDHQICVRATDALGNTDFPTCVPIEILPPFSGLRVRCLHDPIWPQPGETVTITAEALHSSMDALGTTPVTADIEIWFDDTSGPVAAVAENVGMESLAYDVFDIQGAGTFTYACRVAKEGAVVFSGWKLSSVGDPTGTLQGSIPIWKSASTDNALDFSFVADRVSYPELASDPLFLSDVREVLTAYLDFDIFLRNQDRFNFWITPGGGRAGDGDGACIHELPLGSAIVSAFVDTFAILHRNGTRDCAPRWLRAFSTDASDIVRQDGTVVRPDFRVVRHETGHRPFGLADEYCCDGGYRQTSNLPNVYRNQANCEEDAPNLGRTAADCRSWQSSKFLGREWWTSEPDSNDLMNDNTVPRAADIRRILHLFRRCAEGKC